MHAVSAPVHVVCSYVFSHFFVRLMCKYMLIYGALRPPVHLCRSNDSKMEIIARFNYE